jgi:D-alanine-D-alanine ligase-like ATP-grasp enzyme
MCRAAVVAGAGVVLLGPAVGVASAAGGAGAGVRPAAGARAVFVAAWGRAREVPGIGRLNTGGGAAITAVSCPSAGNCSAGGYYTPAAEPGYASAQVFVVSEVHGIWGRAREVPGTAALNWAGGATVNSVSCASAGNCTAGGYLNADSGADQAFVASEVHGTWGRARAIPGGARGREGSFVTSVSCAAAGNCSAGGTYTVNFSYAQAFVVSEVHGTWGRAEEVPGTAALNHGNAYVYSVSCAAAGNCSAGGQYDDNSGGVQGFVASQVHGTWGRAREVPGTAALNQGGGAVINSVSCASAGDCSAGGVYRDRSRRAQAFVVTQVHGTWGKAEEVPGAAALNQGGYAGGPGAQVTSVSCAAAGNCSAGGTYTDSSGHSQGFVVNQVHGIWGQARQVPGTAVLDQGGSAWLPSLSCAAAGNCSAGGTYTDSSGHSQAFVVNQVHGTWGQARQVPGTAVLDQGGSAWLPSLSCAAAGNCSAGGTYTDSSGHSQAFVVNQVHGTWGQARQVPGTAVLDQSGYAAVTAVSCAPAGTCSAGGLYNDSSGQEAFIVNKGPGSNPSQDK